MLAASTRTSSGVGRAGPAGCQEASDACGHSRTVRIGCGRCGRSRSSSRSAAPGCFRAPSWRTGGSCSRAGRSGDDSMPSLPGGHWRATRSSAGGARMPRPCSPARRGDAPLRRNNPNSGPSCPFLPSPSSARARLVLPTANMALRTFVASDGTTWTAWLVQSGFAATVPGTPTEWLAFQNEDNTERRRLLEVPDGWEALPDERLDLLRRMAEPVRGWASRHTPPGGVDQHDPSGSGGSASG